jgi:hypothetical protein
MVYIAFESCSPEQRYIDINNEIQTPLLHLSNASMHRQAGPIFTPSEARLNELLYREGVE